MTLPGAYNTNLAYDLSRFETTARVEDERRSEQQKRAADIKMKSRSVSRSGSKLKIFAVCGAVFAALCAVNITNTNADDWARKVSEQQQLLTEAQERNDLLQSRLDSKANIGYIEEYAANNLGMTKVSNSQINYLEINTENLIEVDIDGSDGIFSSIKDWFKDVLEYIGL